MLIKINKATNTMKLITEMIIIAVRKVSSLEELEVEVVVVVVVVVESLGYVEGLMVGTLEGLMVGFCVTILGLMVVLVVVGLAVVGLLVAGVYIIIT